MNNVAHLWVCSFGEDVRNLIITPCVSNNDDAKFNLFRDMMTVPFNMLHSFMKDKVRGIVNCSLAITM